MSNTMMALPNDHPMKRAWDEWCESDEFKNALKWSTATKYDDDRPISDLQREQHVKGGLWLAFTKGMMEEAETSEETYRLKRLVEALTNEERRQKERAIAAEKKLAFYTDQRNFR